MDKVDGTIMAANTRLDQWGLKRFIESLCYFVTFVLLDNLVTQPPCCLKRQNASLSKNSVLPSKIQQSKQYTSDLSNFLIGEYLGKNKNRVAQIENIGV